MHTYTTAAAAQGFETIEDLSKLAVSATRAAVKGTKESFKNKDYNSRGRSA